MARPLVTAGKSEQNVYCQRCYLVAVNWTLLTNVTTNTLHYSLIGSNGLNHLRLFAYYCYNCSCSSQAIVVPLTGGSCKDPFPLHTLFSLPVWWTVFQDTLRTLGWLRCPWCPPRLETSIDLLFSDVSQPHNALVGTDAVQFQCCYSNAIHQWDEPHKYRR